MMESSIGCREVQIGALRYVPRYQYENYTLKSVVKSYEIVFYSGTCSSTGCSNVTWGLNPRVPVHNQFEGQRILQRVTGLQSLISALPWYENCVCFQKTAPSNLERSGIAAVFEGGESDGTRPEAITVVT